MSKNVGLKKLLNFTRYLLGYEGMQIVLIGRDNMNRNDFSALQIILDGLDGATRVGSFSRYDGENEMLTYCQKISAPVTVDFYGDDAHDEAQRFVLLLSSEKAFNLRRTLGIEVYNQSDIIDLKRLTGEQYSNRLQVVLNIQYNIELTESVLRIDELQYSVITD